MVYSVKKKELYAYTYTESILGHALILSLRILKSFLLLLYFFNLFTLVLSFSFSFLLFFCECLFLFLFLRIIYYGFFTISSIHVWVRCWESFFLCFPWVFLNRPFLAVRLRVHCSGITSTLMRPES